MKSSFVTRIVTFLSISLLKTFDFFTAAFAVNKAVLDKNEFSPGKKLQENHAVFMKEYLAYTETKKLDNSHDFYKVKTDLGLDENWKAVPLVLFGYAIKENCRQFPETIRILQQLPGCSGVIFSVLMPGKHVLPHKGIYKGIYRCLYTLQVEKDSDCWIRIGAEKIYFKTGEWIVFDETFEHEVMNASSKPRVVLYLDFYRSLPFPLNLMNGFISFLLRKSGFVQNILNGYKTLKSVSVEDFKSAGPELL